MNSAFDLASVDFAKGDGLVPAIVQDADSGAVLMMAYMNREALEQTIARESRRVLQPQQAAAVGKR